MRKLGAATLLVLAAACKPQVRGQCVENSDCRAGSVCGPQHLCLDLAGPALSLQVMQAPDSVNGWFPRTADYVEVRAVATDGAGSGVSAPSATLTLDPTVCAANCSYEGVPLAGAGPGVFSFQVPRSTQAAGAERALPFTVNVTDIVGNVGTARGVLQIDDAPPAIGTPFLVTAGTAGEDGQLWFAGGSGAADVEIGIPVSDSGSGVASLTLQLANGDVVAGTPLDVPAVVPRAADGSIHFRLPASAVQGREGPLRFSLVAMDLLQHPTTRSGDPRDLIWVDALPPTVFLANVDYSSATAPAGTPGCAPDATDFACGRQVKTHLLRDDTATVTFDAIDCGAGVAATSQFSAAIRSGGQTKTAPALTQSALFAGTCGNGSPNSIHRYKFTLDLVALAPVLDSPPDATGTSIVRIDATGKDLLSRAATASSTANSGPGLALVSWWRWKRQLTGNVTGAPALLRDLAGARRIALGTDAALNNVSVLGADGTVTASVTASGGVPSEIAVGATNLLYLTMLPAGALPCGGSSTCPGNTMTIVAPSPPSSPSQSRIATCTWANNVLGTAPAIISLGGVETAVAAAQAHSNSGNNLFFFSDAGAGSTTCNSNAQFLNMSNDFRGVAANGLTLFMADMSGFSSLDPSSGSYANGTPVSFNASVNSPAPPAIAPGPNPIFGGDSSDHTVRRTKLGTSNCGLLVSSCWQTDATFTGGGAMTGLPYTPVFDGTNIWTTDSNGSVYSWAQTTGAALLGSSGLAMNARASSPVLLADPKVSKALVVTVDGGLSIVDATKSAATRLGNGGAPAPTGSEVPVAPVLDVRSASQTGIAYVTTPGKWLYAWQIPWLPLAASNSTWPRPGRDSCNSRNTSTDPASCP